LVVSETGDDPVELGQGEVMKSVVISVTGPEGVEVVRSLPVVTGTGRMLVALNPEEEPDLVDETTSEPVEVVCSPTVVPGTGATLEGTERVEPEADTVVVAVIFEEELLSVETPVVLDLGVTEDPVATPGMLDTEAVDTVVGAMETDVWLEGTPGTLETEVVGATDPEVLTETTSGTLVTVVGRATGTVVEEVTGTVVGEVAGTGV
jgi:hypothetical protein